MDALGLAILAGGVLIFFPVPSKIGAPGVVPSLAIPISLIGHLCLCEMSLASRFKPAHPAGGGCCYRPGR